MKHVNMPVTKRNLSKDEYIKAVGRGDLFEILIRLRLQSSQAVVSQVPR